MYTPKTQKEFEMELYIKVYTANEWNCMSGTTNKDYAKKSVESFREFFKN